MPWVRKDDQMPINRKVAALTDAAYRLDDEALCWASRNLTDGRVAADELEGISKRGTLKNAAELVRRRRWHRAEDPRCPSQHCAEPGPDGWVIHDYLDFNPSREKVLKERQLKAARQQRWSDRRRGISTSTPPSRDGARDAGVDAHGDASVTPAPYPPRPAPKEGGGGAPAANAGRRPTADAAADVREDEPPTSRSEPAWATGDRRAELAAQVRAAVKPGPKAARQARAETPPSDVVDNPHYDPTALDRLAGEPTPEETASDHARGDLDPDDPAGS